MHPGKVDRSRLARLEDLPNIGPAMAGDLRRLGIQTPADLAGQDAYVLYTRLSAVTGARQDPCVLDVFLSVLGFLAGDPAQPWWAYSAARRRLLAGPGPGDEAAARQR